MRLCKTKVSNISESAVSLLADQALDVRDLFRSINFFQITHDALLIKFPDLNSLFNKPNELVGIIGVKAVHIINKSTGTKVLSKKHDKCLKN